MRTSVFNERVHVHSLDEYIQAFREGYNDIHYEGKDRASLLALLKLYGERDVEFRYQYAKEIYNDGEKPLAFQIMQQCHEEGYKRAAIGLSTFYAFGIAVEKDPVKGFELLQQGLRDGEGLAFFNAAYYYRHGEGVPKDLHKALEMHKAAAARGVASAGWFGVDTLYDIAKEEGTQVDPKERFELYLSAAQSGNVNAMLKVGECYEYGNGCEVDYGAGAFWYDQAERLLGDEDSRARRKAHSRRANPGIFISWEDDDEDDGDGVELPDFASLLADD